MQALLPAGIDHGAMLAIAVIIAILVLPLAFVADNQLGDAGLGYFGNYFVIYIGAYAGLPPPHTSVSTSPTWTTTRPLSPAPQAARWFCCWPGAFAKR